MNDSLENYCIRWQDFEDVSLVNDRWWNKKALKQEWSKLGKKKRSCWRCQLGERVSVWRQRQATWKAHLDVANATNKGVFGDNSSSKKAWVGRVWSTLPTPNSEGVFLGNAASNLGELVQSLEHVASLEMRGVFEDNAGKQRWIEDLAQEREMHVANAKFWRRVPWQRSKQSLMLGEWS